MKNWSLNSKVWMMIGQLTLGYVFCTGLAITNALESRSALEEISRTYVKRDQLTSEIDVGQRKLMISMFETMLRKDPAAVDANMKDFDSSLAKIRQDFDDYRKIASPEGVTLIGQYIEAFDRFAGTADRARKLGVERRDQEALEVLAGADSVRGEMHELMTRLNDLTAKDLRNFSGEAESGAQRALVLNAAVASLSILVSLLVCFFMLRSLSGAISAVVRGLSDSADQVSAASAQIASASEELSQATTEQAASLEETAASVEQLNSMVAKNSDNAKAAASTSGQSRKRATDGKETVDKMAASMEAISQSNETIMKQINESNEAMSGIVKVIEQIDKKTKVINEIVNKTELLSFNASVEAARAGEHGKGFAVVAEEVGNLARMSGAAAEEIGALLEQSIAKVNQVVGETKTGVEKLITRSKGTVNEGIEVAHECGAVFEEVLGNVTTMSGMATEISSASHEQARGISEITKAMSQLDQMTQQNAATSEECASAAEQLSAQAVALKGAVSRLVLTVNGGKGSPAAAGFHAPETPIPAPTPKTAAPSARKPASNVVHLKAKPRPAGPAPEFALKRAAGGDTPDYDSSGFTDV